MEKVCDRVIILQKGKKIFEGDVWEMTRQQNWFEIETQAPEKTIELLKQQHDIENVVVEKGVLKAFLKNDIKGSEILKYLAQNEVYPDSIIKRKPSLESRFLQMTD